MIATDDQDDNIQRAFTETFGSTWGMIAKRELRQKMFAAMHDYRGNPKQLGNELWLLFHERWPHFLGFRDWIDNRLGNEFVRIYEGRPWRG